MNENNAAAGPVPGELRITTTWQDACRVVAAAGQVDATNTHRLHAALSLALHLDRPLVADLSQVTSLDSHGLSTLHLNQRNAVLQGARLLVVSSPAIAALLVPAEGGSMLTVCPA